ncbi:MAG: phytanoyl-CoA dioxygenase family protein [Verrucomicrobia bacterium]|nr:phytanoyl-CoA dioxygenase family protein [Verrucomicrobiota bacterium]MDA1086767.1 phytanoyl-CoA dioxygenase family protein [Verrucomicrobiota bacterium]
MSDINPLIEQFDRDGFLVIPNALTKHEAEQVRRGVERTFAQPDETANLYGGIAASWRPTMFERGEEFEALVDNPRIIDIVEAILGNDCHLIAMSALKTGPGESVAPMFHVDETVRFPRPKDVPLDPRIPVPCSNLNLNYYLCDVDEELGPTQLVPTSHRSGRAPEPADHDKRGLPAYEGRHAVFATGEAGTAVMWHDQIWHRGAPNRSKDKIRWVQQSPYASRFIAQRFRPFINYHFPDEILARANPRRRRLFGDHPPGAYG